ncbi:MAG TPA: hypothetical protein VK498_02360 [Ferruginibacter sp.]|nr:hypothetical protein [Ferruginibacter sp.]
MNTFENHIGKVVKRILLLEEGYQRVGSPLGIFFMFDEVSGLLIEFNFYELTINLRHFQLPDLESEFNVEYGDTILVEQTKDDLLTKLIGHSIKSIKLGQFQDANNLHGDNFVIKAGEYAGAIIQFDNTAVTFYSTNDSGKFIFDSNELFTHAKKWELV